MSSAKQRTRVRRKQGAMQQTWIGLLWLRWWLWRWIVTFLDLARVRDKQVGQWSARAARVLGRRRVAQQARKQLGGAAVRVGLQDAQRGAGRAPLDRATEGREAATFVQKEWHQEHAHVLGASQAAVRADFGVAQLLVRGLERAARQAVGVRKHEHAPRLDVQVARFARQHADACRAIVRAAGALVRVAPAATARAPLVPLHDTRAREEMAPARWRPSIYITRVWVRLHVHVAHTTNTRCPRRTWRATSAAPAAAICCLTRA